MQHLEDLNTGAGLEHQKSGTELELQIPKEVSQSADPAERPSRDQEAIQTTAKNIVQFIDSKGMG